MNRLYFKLGEGLFRRCSPLYRWFYACYKVLSDRQEREQIRKVVHAGMTVVDVGAGIGSYTRLLSRLVGFDGHVHAFEPSEQNFVLLERGISGRKNVTVLQAAVGERTGNTDLYLSDELNVDHRTYDTGEGRHRVRISLIRLDDYFAPGARVDFVKIDVQGSELSVLKGAERIIRENREIKLLVEFWPEGLAQAGVKPAEFLDYLASRGLSYRTVGNIAEECFKAERAEVFSKDQYWNLMVSRAD